MSLQRALLLSIAFHALLLTFVRPPSSPLPQKANELPIVARLVEPLLAQAPVEAQPPEVKPAPTSRRVAPIARRADPMPELAPQQTALEEPRENQPQQEARVEGIPEEAPVTAAALPSPQFDPGELARYRLEIIAAARQFRRYPPVARENGWQGRAEVRVSFDGARQPALAISRSSGYPVLDRQAVETLSNALAPLPAMLLGRSFELDFPVVFSLED